MHRILTLLVLALVLVAPCAANAADARAGGASKKLVVKLKVGKYQEVAGAVDRDPAGPSKGDIHRLLMPLFNTEPRFGKARGARVGQLAEYDELTSRTTAIVQGVASRRRQDRVRGQGTDELVHHPADPHRRRHRPVQERARPGRHEPRPDHVPPHPAVGHTAGMRAFAAAIALTLVAVSTAAAAEPLSTNPGSLLVIQVKSLPAGASASDKPPKGVSKGDLLRSRSHLVNVARQFGKPAGARVGSDEARIVVTGARTGRVEGVATLPGGTIRFAGDIRLDSNAPIPVTGGTGKYAHARGTLIVGDGDTPLNTYHLRLRTRADDPEPIV